MFGFLNDEYVKIMLDLSRTKFTNDDISRMKEQIKSIDLNNLFSLCVQHELVGVVGSAICTYNITALPTQWMEEYNRQKGHLGFLKEKAKEVCQKMYDNNIPMVILKNGGIMIDMIDDVAACPMEDIDSLVRKSDFKKAHEILISSGFVFKFRSEFEFEKLEEAYQDGSTEYYIMTPIEEKMWFVL